jgi:hypothetical protein
VLLYLYCSYCNSQNLWHLWVFFYSIIFFWEVHIRARTSTYVWRTNLHFQYV